MNYEEIAAMLAAGKSEEDIAKEFTNALNKASADRKAAEEAKKAEDAKSKKMDQIALAVSKALNEYALLAGVKDVKLTQADVRNILDEFLPVIEQFKDVKIHVAKAPVKVAAKDVFKTAEDVFANLFREMNW